MNPKKNLFIVADGMGGHNGGDIASGLAVKEIPEFFSSHQDEPENLINLSIKKANQAIFERGKGDPKLVGMGTTVVQMYFKGPNLFLGNVGDSRAYLINKKRLYQLSRDHSLVQEKMNIGIYSREDAKADPHKNVLVRAVGFEADIPVDVFNFKVHRNDIFFICSDGLHGKVSDKDMLYIINKNIPDPAKATQARIESTVAELVQQANNNGGNDNISVILVVAQ